MGWVAPWLNHHTWYSILLWPMFKVGYNNCWFIHFSTLDCALVSYCFLTNYHKFRSLKQHTFIILLSKIPWMEEPGSLQSMESRRVRHNWATSLSHIGEGNGNPLQCSCLENPRVGGAWWAAVYGVAQSWTRLKGLSSSSRGQEPQVGLTGLKSRCQQGCVLFWRL